MAVYIERENREITPEEWLHYIDTDSELVLSERGTAINPITKQTMKFLIFGRALWRDDEIVYNKGRIVCENCSPELLEKLSEIAAALSANVYDCGEKIV